MSDAAPPFGDDPSPAQPAPEPTRNLRLHRLDELEWHPTAQIILFDSLKAAEAGAKLLPKAVCLGWDGNWREVDHYDWTPLDGREFFIWPGASRISSVANQSLTKRLKQAVLLRTPPEWSPPAGANQSTGLDISHWPDIGGNQQQAETWLAREQARLEDEYEAIRIAENNATPAPSVDDPQTHQPVADDINTWPFRLLGFDEGIYYYLPQDTQQIVGLEAGAHTEANLCVLAPFDFWCQVFPKGDRGSAPSYPRAREALIRLQGTLGLFNPSINRGRGCWIDGDQVVFHAGDQLIVKNTSVPLSGLRSRFVYQRGNPLSPELAEPLKPTEAVKFLKLCDALNWTAPLNGRLLAGWCMAAAVCGALTWRPHIWISGPAGSGKSWTVENIIIRFLDRFTLSVLSSSTEAGMRQSIRSDALAIVLDEAESEDEKARQRMKSILDLVRQSSSESGGAIVKGSSTGSAVEYRVRSCFCFSSIGVAAVARADTSRITVLSMHNRNHDAENFERIKELARETVLDSAYAASLRARAINLAKEIRENARLFAAAVSLKLGDARTGDQLGALLAGAFALTSSKLITPDAARTWVEAQDWTDFSVAQADKDENRALSALTEYVVRIETDRGPRNTSIGNLIEEYYNPATGTDARVLAADFLLLRGVKVTQTHIDVSNSHQEVARIYQGTIWAGKWKDQLKRVVGAVGMLESAKFGLSTTRAVRLRPLAFGLDPLAGAEAAPIKTVMKSVTEQANQQAQLAGADF